MNNNDTIIVDISFCNKDDENEEFMCLGLLQLCKYAYMDNTDKDNQVMKVRHFQS